MEFAWNTQKGNARYKSPRKRIGTVRKKISNQRINFNKTNLNYGSIKSNLSLYQKLKKKIDKVRSMSKIQKNSVFDYFNIITVPKNQYKECEVEKSKEYSKEIYNYFYKEFGKKKVLLLKCI